MTIIFAYIFYFVGASLSPLQQRWLLKNKNFTFNEQITFTFQCICFLFLGSLFFPFFSPFYLTGGIKILWLAIISGIFGAWCNVFEYMAKKHLDVGVASVIGNIYTPVTIIFSSILLREGLTNTQIIGTVLLLVAMVIVSKKHRIGKFSFDKYFWYMLLSGTLLSVVLVVERDIQITTGFSAGTMISWGAQTLSLGILALVLGNRHTYTKKEVAITGTLQFIRALSWVVLVWTVGNLSLVSSVTTFKVVILFIAGAIFLGEREDLPRKILGSVIAVLGLLLM